MSVLRILYVIINTDIRLIKSTVIFTITNFYIGHVMNTVYNLAAFCLITLEVGCYIISMLH
jgi:hypothetical protein